MSVHLVAEDKRQLRSRGMWTHSSFVLIW